MDPAALARLAARTDLDALVRRLDAMPDEALAALAASDAPPRPTYVPPTPDVDFYGLFARRLTSEQQAARAAIRRVMLARVRPVINEHWERGTMPHDLVPDLAAMLREAFGPDPARRYCEDPVLTGLVSMEIPRVDPSIGTFIGVHWGLCLVSLYRFGSDAQKAEWWGPL